MNKEIRSRLIEGINLFNTGKYYEAHDFLEDLWYDVHDKSKDFIQSLIHLAVGFYHITEKDNPNGAILQLNKSIKKLEPYKPKFENVDTRKLGEEIESCIKEIERYMDGKIKKFRHKMILNLL